MVVSYCFSVLEGEGHARTNLILYYPLAHDLQGAIVYPLVLPLHVQCGCWELLCASPVGLLLHVHIDDSLALLLLRQPTVGSVYLLISGLNRCSTVGHGVSSFFWVGAQVLLVAIVNWGQLRANGTQDGYAREKRGGDSRCPDHGDNEQ